MTKIGALHPYRTDPGLVAFIEEHLPLDAELDIRGPQDGMTDDELRALSEGVEPNSHAEMLADGSTVHITRDVVLEGMVRQSEALLADGCDAVLVCCTLPWPELDALPHVITPCAVLESTAASMVGSGGTIGVVQPVADAADEEIEHWLALGERQSLAVVATCAAPELPGEDVLASDDDYRAVTATLLEQGAHVIVLDCMAFTEHHRDVVAAAAGGIPVLRAMRLTAEVVAHGYI